MVPLNFLRNTRALCNPADKDVAFYREALFIQIHWQLFDTFLFFSSVKCIIMGLTMNAIIKKYHAFNSCNLKVLFHEQKRVCLCVCKSQFSLDF